MRAKRPEDQVFDDALPLRTSAWTAPRAVGEGVGAGVAWVTLVLHLGAVVTRRADVACSLPGSILVGTRRAQQAVL